ncbi:MAG: hypothetical protein ACI9MR_004188 [Myxococcota bacterium]|jgi:hypothetical protein
MVCVARAFANLRLAPTDNAADYGVADARKRLHIPQI